MLSQMCNWITYNLFKYSVDLCVSVSVCVYLCLFCLQYPFILFPVFAAPSGRTLVWDIGSEWVLCLCLDVDMNVNFYLHCDFYSQLT